MSTLKIFYFLLISILVFGCAKKEDPLSASNEETTISSNEDSNEDSNEETTTSLGDNLTKGFMLDELNAFGATVLCNGKSAKEFIPRVGETVNCLFKDLTLATFTGVQKKTPDQGLQIDEADQFLNQATKSANAVSLIKTMAKIEDQTVEFQLTKLEKLSFVNYYQNDLGLETEDFELLLRQAEEDVKTTAGFSTHVSKIEAAVTEGASSDLSASFVSADAEKNLQYKPTKRILSNAVLTDNLSRPIQGLEYFSSSNRGRTDSSGKIEFVWGENILFGIDTFELGQVHGNKLIFKLSDLNPGHIGRNTERLIQRFSQISPSLVSIPDIVYETFEKFPNSINDIINLSLSEDTVLDTGNGETTLAGEFNKQFEDGLAKIIDQTISDWKASNPAARSSSRGAERTTYRSASKATADDAASILEEVKKLWGVTSGWAEVKRFHVFHETGVRAWAMQPLDCCGWNLGDAWAQSTINIANPAFPVMMARNDVNYWIPFGEKAAYDENKMAFITEAPSQVIPDNVSGAIATYNLPFIAIGEIGLGKVMVVGNARYNSILTCPNGYIEGGGVDSQGQCMRTSDPDNMKHFFQNTLRYLSSSNTTDENQTINVGTNIPYVYFKLVPDYDSGRFSIGTQANFIIDQTAFNATTTQKISGEFSGLNPSEMQILILNGFDYCQVTNGCKDDWRNPNPKMTADIGSSKLSEDDVTALIDYVSRGGSILIMETINQPNPEPLSRLVDSAGIAVGHGRSVVLNGSGPNSEGVSGNRSNLTGFSWWHKGIPPFEGYSSTGIAGFSIRPRSVLEKGLWVIERYPYHRDIYGTGKPKPAYNIDNTTGEVSWVYIEEKKDPGIFKPKHGVAFWYEDNDPLDNKYYAYIEVDNQTSEELEAQKLHVLNKFSDNGTGGYKECTDPNYHYEVNCLEYRPGNGIPTAKPITTVGSPNKTVDSNGVLKEGPRFGRYGQSHFVPKYTELFLGKDEAKAMIKAADLGTNIQHLHKHELYFRSKGKKGIRLSSVDVNRIYMNMTVWLWNDIEFRYDSTKEDELGFKDFTEYLNCYTNDQHGGGTACPSSLKKELTDNNMIHGSGTYANMLNPGYPINYMEKPITRLMLGRSYWDLKIKVDIREYPGEPTATSGGGGAIFLDFSGNGAGGDANNMQSTGQWAVAHQAFTASVDTNSTVRITIALNDDLTSREKHEKSMKRPPRITKKFTLNSGSLGRTHTFTVPYGGLIYAESSTDNLTLTLTNTVNAPWYKLAQDGIGQWINPVDSSAPIGEIESKTFIYTAAKKNLKASNYGGDVKIFAEKLDTFASDLDELYARDEDSSGDKENCSRCHPLCTCSNRKRTDSSIPNFKFRWVNDIAISKGGAHSGYPIMWINFKPDSEKILQNPLNSWTLGHEVGHNVNEAPFFVYGACEVVNNLLALYSQDKHLGKMKGLEFGIRTAPELVAAEKGHAWTMSGGGSRLLMYAQLKIWAEQEFDISQWYDSSSLPAYYNNSPVMKGWNMFKLMHRLTRNETESSINLKGSNKCYGQNLKSNDNLMLCSSYVAQKDLTDFFTQWNPGEKSNFIPGLTEPKYRSGISQAGKDAVAALKLPKPTLDPLTINSLKP